ncbi:MAG: M28 family peptidase [Nitrospirota bacterium]
MNNTIPQILMNVSRERLQWYVKKIEGLRHGSENYHSLEKKAVFIEDTLRSLNLKVENQQFIFHGRSYRNIVAFHQGIDEQSALTLIGAHYDAAWGSPGADDNASGVAVLLEAANVIFNLTLNNSIQFVAFSLEEPQLQTIQFLIGSDHFARQARKSKIRYRAILILESVGYTDETEGSQFVPLFVRIPVPKTANFLGVIANSKSKMIMRDFCGISREFVPDLPIVPYKVPLSGRIVPESRFSDHASFWDYGYPALMLTDTAMFRNPHYHTSHDRSDTLDFDFLSNVTKAVISFMLRNDMPDRT